MKERYRRIYNRRHHVRELPPLRPGESMAEKLNGESGWTTTVTVQQLHSASMVVPSSDGMCNPVEKQAPLSDQVQMTCIEQVSHPPIDCVIVGAQLASMEQNNLRQLCRWLGGLPHHLRMFIFCVYIIYLGYIVLFALFYVVTFFNLEFGLVQLISLELYEHAMCILEQQCSVCSNVFDLKEGSCRIAMRIGTSSLSIRSMGIYFVVTQGER